MALVTVCTAVVSGLLMVAVALLLLPPQPDELLFNLVADPGVRGGTAFGTVLLTFPALLLLDQAVRLGTAARERRLAALRLAGATPAQVRLLGTFEVALPSLLGGILGLGVYALLRATFGGIPRDAPPDPFARVSTLDVRLVPTTVTPHWWQFLLVVLAVTLAGAAVGLLSSRGLAISPFGVTRRHRTAPPRPWGLLGLLAAACAGALTVPFRDSATVLGMGAVALAVGGIVVLAPWAAHRMGRRAQRRARSASGLLAAGRLLSDPRPAGRAAAAVGGISLVSGGAAALTADILAPVHTPDAFYTVSLLIVAMVLLLALVAAAWTLAVHTVESLLDRRRSTAALVAVGVTTEDLQRSQRTECALVAVPLSVVGVLVGTLSLGPFVQHDATGVVVMLMNLAVTPALVWVAIVVAVRLVRPWTVRAGAPGNLRTE